MGRAHVWRSAISWLLLHAPSGVESICSGLSSSCPEKTTQEACEGWATCEWSAGGSPAGGACCAGGLLCEDENNRKDCEFHSSCSWACDSWVGSGSGSQVTSGTDRRRRTVNWFCTGKISGSYCSDKTVVICSGGSPRPTSTEYCSDGRCSEFGMTASCGAANYCAGKLSGSYCDGTYMTVCANGKRDSIQDCRTAGCSDGIRARTAFCGSSTFCVGKLTGSHCDGDTAVKSCPDNSVVEICRGGVKCTEGPGAGVATCGSSMFCAAKLSGSFCDGPYLKVCDGGKVVSSKYCGSCEDGGVGRAECGSATFCKGRLSGGYCDGNVVKECLAGSQQPTTQEFCEEGCLEGAAAEAGASLREVRVAGCGSIINQRWPAGGTAGGFASGVGGLRAARPALQGLGLTAVTVVHYLR